MSTPAELVRARALTWSDTLRAHAVTAPVLLISAVCFALVYAGGPWWVVAPLVLLQVHFMHANLIAFHEAAHFNFAPARWYNEAIGLFIGGGSLMSLTLYRAVHHAHHSHLGTEADDELWPHTRPDAPRWQRRLVAAFELCFGLFATPLLFLRSFLRAGGPVREQRVRRRIWAELALLAAVWGSAVGVVAWFGLWAPFLVAWVLPSFLTGNLAMWRKYVEHVGLTGRGPAGLTRLIAGGGWFGRVVAALLIYEPYHPVHHLYAGLPAERLPAFAPDLPTPDPTSGGPPQVFPSYAAAAADLIRHLPDPRVGSQWQNAKAA